MVAASSYKSSRSSESTLLPMAAGMKLRSGKEQNTTRPWLVDSSHPRPPKTFKCSTCDKHFSSSQALGGHRNVHRRGKAIVKQLPMVHHHCCIQQNNHTARQSSNPYSYVVNRTRLTLSLSPFTVPAGSSSSFTQGSASYYHHSVPLVVLSTREMRPFFIYPPPRPGSKPIRFYNFLDSKLEEENKIQQKYSRVHMHEADHIDVKPNATNLNLNMPPVLTSRSQDIAASHQSFYLQHIRFGFQPRVKIEMN